MTVTEGHLRPAREADVPSMLAIYAPYVLNTSFSFEYDVPTEEEFLSRFREITKRLPWFVWEEEGKVLGYAYASLPFERKAYAFVAELSVYLAPEAHRRGIGSALYARLEAILRDLGYLTVYALVTEANPVSEAFHRAMGYHVGARFERVGWKQGHFLGVTWFEKALAPCDPPAAFPRAFQG